MDIRIKRVYTLQPSDDQKDIERLQYYPDASMEQIMDDNYDYLKDKKLEKKKKKHDKIQPYIRNKRFVFDRRTLTYYILGGCDIALEKYLNLAEKLHMKKKIILDYDRFKEYHEVCGCPGCILPCVKMAHKRGYFKNMRWNQFLQDYDQI
jgi:hypothetical protein